jgi:hypothetical protein
VKGRWSKTARPTKYQQGFGEAHRRFSDLQPRQVIVPQKISTTLGTVSWATQQLYDTSTTDPKHSVNWVLVYTQEILLVNSETYLNSAIFPIASIKAFKMATNVALETTMVCVRPFKKPYLQNPILNSNRAQ